jgi:hypothetical protein
VSDDTPPIMRAPKVTTNITLSRSVWTWLKMQAADRTVREGGQPSLAAVIEQTILEKFELDHALSAEEGKDGRDPDHPSWCKGCAEAERLYQRR